MSNYQWFGLFTHFAMLPLFLFTAAQVLVTIFMERWPGTGTMMQFTIGLLLASLCGSSVTFLSMDYPRISLLFGLKVHAAILFSLVFFALIGIVTWKSESRSARLGMAAIFLFLWSVSYWGMTKDLLAIPQVHRLFSRIIAG
jgi:hypothetical protein